MGCLSMCKVGTKGIPRCKVKDCPGSKWTFMYGRTDTCIREGYSFNPDGDPQLIKHVMNVVKDSESAPPPGVPTTCYGISNVNTPTSWKYESFADRRGTRVGDEAGDGTVTIASAIGPCKLWRDAFNESTIGYIEQSMPRAKG